MKLQLRGGLLDETEDAGVGDDDPVRPDLANGLNVFRQFFDIAVVREEVERQIGALAAGVGKSDALQNFVERKVRSRAQRKVGRSHIHGVGAVKDRHFQLLQRPGRHEQFGGAFHGQGLAGRFLLALQNARGSVLVNGRVSGKAGSGTNPQSKDAPKADFNHPTLGERTKTASRHNLLCIYY